MKFDLLVIKIPKSTQAAERAGVKTGAAKRRRGDSVRVALQKSRDGKAWSNWAAVLQRGSRTVLRERANIDRKSIVVNCREQAAHRPPSSRRVS